MKVNGFEVVADPNGYQVLGHTETTNLVEIAITNRRVIAGLVRAVVANGYSDIAPTLILTEYRVIPKDSANEWGEYIFATVTYGKNRMWSAHFGGRVENDRIVWSTYMD